MIIKDNFDDIRPFTAEEAGEAFVRVAAHPHFTKMAASFFPETDPAVFREDFIRLRSVDEFQQKIMNRVIHTILKESSSGLTYRGFENLDSEKNYIFLANHRDILLDSAILQVLLHMHDLKTSEITFGSNLMNDAFVIDLGKLNKMFKIYREGSFRELYRNTVRISQYMRCNITTRKESVWIAQRNGRTKDGNDITEIGVLKMFCMSSEKNFADNLAELNITPVSISYEYEPCDFYKTQEIYIRRRKKYTKGLHEDLNSILHGIRQWKGGIHLAISAPLGHSELVIGEHTPDKFKTVARFIDTKIYEGYKLWPNNYIAFDLINHSEHYPPCYTEEQKQKFIRYMEQGLSHLTGDKEELKEIFLHIYGNPVLNKEKNSAGILTIGKEQVPEMQKKS